MAIAYNVVIRNAMLDSVTSNAGTLCKLRIYNGTRPATGGAVTTKLSELICNVTFAGASASGVLTLNVISNDTNAAATGTASWFRIVKTDGTTHVLDGDVGVSASDLNLVTTSIVATQTVSVTSFVLTEGNP